MSETGVPCDFCEGLLGSVEDGELSLTRSTGEILQALQNGCPICQIIWHGLRYFAKENDWNVFLEPHHYIEFTLPSAGYPLRVRVLTHYLSFPEIEFFTNTGTPSPWPVFRPAELIERRSNSSECFQLVKNWIIECELNHPNCKTTGPTLLPSRIIKIRRSDGLYEPFLHESNGESARFAALSYCWGSDQPLKTTKTNLPLNRKAIEWSSIPKTIQDAIVITDRLGLEYLWVDSLAIIQDDPDDWTSESAKMRDIYSTAHITISATRADGCRTGLFSKRLRKTFQVWPFGWSPLECHSSDVKINVGPVLARPRPCRRISAYPLSTRAWALQEHLLSRRVIQYLPSELLWNCRQSIAWESQQTLRSWDLIDSKDMIGLFRTIVIKFGDMDNPHHLRYLHKLWDEVVQNYTQRHLTIQLDKLPALSGLAKEFQPVLGPYFAGFWENDLLASLTWESNTYSDTHTPLNYIIPSYIAPSWSWASVTGQVFAAAYREFMTPQNVRCTILETNFQATTADRTGTVQSGTIIIRARSVKGKLKRVSETKFGDKWGALTGGTGTLIIKDRTYYSITTDFTEYIGRDKDPAKTDEMRETTYATASWKFLNISTWLRSYKKTNIERCKLKAPCPVYCLLLGSMLNNQGRPQHPSYEVVLLLIPSRAVPGSFERVGITCNYFNNVFHTAQERDIKLV